MTILANKCIFIFFSEFLFPFYFPVENKTFIFFLIFHFYTWERNILITLCNYEQDAYLYI